MDSIFSIIKGIGIGLIIVLIQAAFLDNLNIVLIEGYDFLNRIITFLILFSLALPLAVFAYTPIWNKFYSEDLYTFFMIWQNFVFTLYIITTFILYSILSVTFFENEIFNNIILINSYCFLGVFAYKLLQIYDKKSHQYFDFRFFVKNIESYSGDKKKNKYHGEGILILKNDEKYEGKFLKGKFYGFGTYTYGPKSTAPGEKYEGYFKNGEKSGKGVLTHSEQILDGYFIDGQANGYGEVKFEGGDTYKGEFKDGKKHGYGTYKHDTGEIHKGFYKNDMFVERDED